MPLVRVPGQFFDALVDHADGLRGHLCLRALPPALFKRPRNRSRLLSDPTHEACDHIIALAAPPLGHIPLFDEPGSTGDLALSSRITRSPPAA